MPDHLSTDYTADSRPNPANGYLQFWEPRHPLASTNGMVFLARHVASQMTGDWLTANQVVIHLDGNHQDCSLENLKVITRAELVKSWPSHNVKRIGLVCSNPDCRKDFYVIPSDADRRFCSPECAREMTRRFHVDPREMAQLVWEMPTSHIAQEYGVSDVAIAKFCKKHDIKKPPRGYWAKLYAGQIDPIIKGEI